jgi:hypothetical protein
MLCARSDFFAAMKEGTDDLVEVDEGTYYFCCFVTLYSLRSDS